MSCSPALGSNSGGATRDRCDAFRLTTSIRELGISTKSYASSGVASYAGGSCAAAFRTAASYAATSRSSSKPRLSLLDILLFDEGPASVDPFWL